MATTRIATRLLLLSRNSVSLHTPGTFNNVQKTFFNQHPSRLISTSTQCFQHGKRRDKRWENTEEGEEREKSIKKLNDIEEDEGDRNIRNYSGTAVPDTKVEDSMAYMESEVFKSRYGEYPIYYFYRRNHKGNIPPRKTRATCIRGGVIATGNPCPICRDPSLTVDYRNLELLKHFLSEESGEVLQVHKTGVCMKQQKRLVFAVHKARDLGLLPASFEDRYYDYKDYYPDLADDDVVMLDQPEPPQPANKFNLTYPNMLKTRKWRELLKRPR